MLPVFLLVVLAVRGEAQNLDSNGDRHPELTIQATFYLPEAVAIVGMPISVRCAATPRMNLTAVWQITLRHNNNILATMDQTGQPPSLRGVPGFQRTLGYLMGNISDPNSAFLTFYYRRVRRSEGGLFVCEVMGSGSDSRYNQRELYVTQGKGADVIFNRGDTWVGNMAPLSVTCTPNLNCVGPITYIKLLVNLTAASDTSPDYYWLARMYYDPIERKALLPSGESGGQIYWNLNNTYRSYLSVTFDPQYYYCIANRDLCVIKTNSYLLLTSDLNSYFSVERQDCPRHVVPP